MMPRARTVTKGSPIAFRRKSPPVKPSILANGMHLVGLIESPGDVQIDGRFEGTIRCKSLAIGCTGQIEGDIAAEEVVVRGCVYGDILGGKVEIFQPGRVHGEILHNALFVHDGAGLLGRTQHTDDPLNLGAVA